jgi:UDP-N-acetylmuramate: L-alanyl-gamma-D-glutamyl-meso-diaminopimelate ligase
MHYYFLGIAGAGVSALASILVSQGHTVSGSDEGVYPPVSTYLENLGIPFATSFAEANVPTDVDFAIIGTSAKLNGSDNPEYAEIVRRGIPHSSFAEALGKSTAERDNIVVAGSFGKSSLTALITYLMRANGLHPGHFIGAIPLDLETTGEWGSDMAFVMEADEYVVSLTDRRSKFELYRPRHTLISSIIHDHVNMFPTVESYTAPFRKLVKSTPHDGLLVCARGFPALEQVTSDRSVIWYGAGEGEGWASRNTQVGEETRFDLVSPEGQLTRLSTQMLGTHSIENIVGASALLVEGGYLTTQQIADALPSFRGVARRLDKKTRSSTIPAYEGFGSSYEKARSAIEAIQLHFPSQRLIVVFEPHTFSWRNVDALEWYDTVFEGVDAVYLLPPPQHGAGTHAQLTQLDIRTRIRASGVTVFPAANGQEVLSELKGELRPGDVVLLLSSGPLDGLARTVPEWLDAKFSA